MQLVHAKAFQRNEAVGFSVKALLALQVITLVLMIANAAGDVGPIKAIITNLPILASASVMLVAVRAAAQGNETRAKNILSFGVLLVAATVLFAVR